MLASSLGAGLSIMRAVAPALSKLLVRAFAAEASLARSPSSLPKQHWYTVHEHERLISPLTRNDEEEEGVFESHHPSQRFAEVLSNLRSSYPEAVWKHIEALFPDRRKRNTVAIDIAVGAEGRVGVELSRRGFHAIGIEADATLLARTFRFAQARSTPIELVTAKVERQVLPDASAELVTFMHGLHLVDTQLALEEAHRLLAGGGRLVAAWNDRDLSSEFMCELESLFERYNPHYRILRLQEYSVHPNPLRMRNAAALLDILDCMSFVRSALRGSQRKAFNADARAVVAARYGREPFDLPLETKMYVLEKNEHCAAPPMGVRPHH